MTSTSKIGFFPKGSVWFAALGIILSAAAARAQSSYADAGLVTKLSGEATYWNKDEQNRPDPVQAFMKLRKGDHIKLSGPASLQMLYFSSGRQETWKGPGTLIVGDMESAAAAYEKPLSPPEVVIFPTKVTKRLEDAPLPLPRSRTCYSGVILTRRAKSPSSMKGRVPAPLSAKDKNKIKEANKIYEDLKKKAKADDITPELYLLGVLADYRQYQKMEKLINTMEIKRPGDATLKDIKIWAQSQSASQN